MANGMLLSRRLIVARRTSGKHYFYILTMALPDSRA